MQKQHELPNVEDVLHAQARIRPFVNKTPVFTCASLNQMFGAQLYFKCENFQKAGSFKIRGATNAVLKLTPAEAKRGVVTHSTGNHGAALALAAKRRGIESYIVTPKNVCLVKKSAIEGYGGKIILCDAGLEAREQKVQEIVEMKGALFIPPSDSKYMIAGDATTAIELLEETEHLDMIIVPVGGGGHASGICITTTHWSPGTLVYGVEPETADDARRSFEAGRLIPVPDPQSVADGLTGPLSEMSFSILRETLYGLTTVSEQSIVSSMRLIWERMKIIVEASAAVPLAALSENKIDVAGKRVGLIISGGNVDLTKLPWRPRAL